VQQKVEKIQTKLTVLNDIVIPKTQHNKEFTNAKQFFNEQKQNSFKIYTRQEVSTSPGNSVPQQKKSEKIFDFVPPYLIS
jgi:hypothetical protein